MSSDYQVDFNNCPVGIKNAGNICRVEDRLNMAIEKLTDKVGKISFWANFRYVDTFDFSMATIALFQNNYSS